MKLVSGLEKSKLVLSLCSLYRATIQIFRKSERQLKLYFVNKPGMEVARTLKIFRYWKLLSNSTSSSVVSQKLPCICAQRFQSSNPKASKPGLEIGQSPNSEEFLFTPPGRSAPDEMYAYQVNKANKKQLTHAKRMKILEASGRRVGLGCVAFVIAVCIL